MAVVDLLAAFSEWREATTIGDYGSAVNYEFVRSPPGSPSPVHLRRSSGPNTGVIATVLAAARPRGLLIAGSRAWLPAGTKMHYADWNGTGFTVATVATGTFTAGNQAFNMVDAGTHVVAVDGVDARASTASVLTTVTPPAGTFSSVAYQDGYTVYARSGTDEFYVSALDDPTTIGALDFSTADALPGDIVGLISDHRELVIFKESSIEFWSNTGGSFPFARSQPGVAERGCWGAGTIAKYDNEIFWIGDDQRAYAMRGYQPRAISGEGVGHLMRSLAAGGAPGIRCSTYTTGGFPKYRVEYTDESAAYALVYSIDTGLWNKETQSSWGFASGVAVFGAAQGQTVAAARFGVDAKIVLLDANSPGTCVVRLPEILAPGGEAMMRSVTVDGDTPGPAGVLVVIDNDSATATMTRNAPTMVSAKYGRVRWGRLGRFRKRILEITMSHNTITRILADIEPLAGP